MSEAEVKETERPEYVTCVVDLDRPRYAVCGRYIGFAFAFAGWPHADGAVADGSRLVVCPECAAARDHGGLFNKT